MTHAFCHQLQYQYNSQQNGWIFICIADGPIIRVRVLLCMYRNVGMALVPLVLLLVRANIRCVRLCTDFVISQTPSFHLYRKIGHHTYASFHSSSRFRCYSTRLLLLFARLHLDCLYDTTTAVPAFIHTRTRTRTRTYDIILIKKTKPKRRQQNAQQ